jgi:capsular polysaccharide biosynthesis protein
MIRLFDSETPADPPRLRDGASAAPCGELSDQSDQSRYRLDVMRSSRMHRLLALGFPLVGLTLSVVYMVSYGSIGRVSIGPVSIGTVSIATVSLYTAQSLVYIQPPPHWPNNDDPAAYDSYIQQQMLSMTRPEVLAGALKMLAPGAWQQSGESEDSAADRLRGAVEVARVGAGYLVAITAHANNPDTAAALANAVAASYIENNAREQKAGDTARLTVLKEEQERIRKELDDDRAEQATLNAQLAQMTRATTGVRPKLQRSSELANDITRLQDLYNTVDEQLQNQIMEDRAPGTAHLAEAAVPPSQFAIAGAVRNALLLLFAFILLGLAVAVVTHKMDPPLRMQGRTAERAVAQSPRTVPEATPASPAREIPALAETGCIGNFGCAARRSSHAEIGHPGTGRARTCGSRASHHSA